MAKKNRLPDKIPGSIINRLIFRRIGGNNRLNMLKTKRVLP
jgi:hypothetical protein